MLNSNIVKLAEALDILCVEGYNTIDKKEILDTLAESLDCTLTNDMLDEEIKGLMEKKFVIVKYQDSEQVCLSITDDGRELLARVKAAKQEQEATRKQKRALKKESKAEGVGEEKFELVASKPNPYLATINATPQKRNFKSFLISFAGGVLGGILGGVAVALIVLFV